MLADFCVWWLATYSMKWIADNSANSCCSIPCSMQKCFILRTASPLILLLNGSFSLLCLSPFRLSTDRLLWLADFTLHSLLAGVVDSSLPGVSWLAASLA